MPSILAEPYRASEPYALLMPRRPVDPLAATDVVVVDASNFLHALQRGRSALPAAALIGRIRAMIPAAIAVELVFDGTPEPGMRRAHVAAGVQVRYAAPLSADDAILARARSVEFEARGRLLVVSDDGELRRELERLGARTARSAWLVGRLERGVLAAPASGNRRPPGSGSAAWAPRDGRARDGRARDGRARERGSGGGGPGGGGPGGGGPGGGGPGGRPSRRETRFGH
jgi:hypothetical protein